VKSQSHRAFGYTAKKRGAKGFAAPIKEKGMAFFSEIIMSIDSVGQNSVIAQQAQVQTIKPTVTQPVELKPQAEKVLPAQRSTTSTSQTELDKSIEQIQVMMDLRQRSVQFTTDNESGSKVVKVVDGNSGDVIRQMPAEELLSFMRNLTRMMGTFIDKST
jgi:flagellar protein FlaG